jgi:hypothetical protein
MSGVVEMLVDVLLTICHEHGVMMMLLIMITYG